MPRFSLFSGVIRLPSAETSLDAIAVGLSGGLVVADGTFDNNLLP